MSNRVRLRAPDRLNSRTKPIRLRESATVLDESMTVSDAAWEGDAADYTPAQWRKATILHLEPDEGQDGDVKDLHKLPVKSPDGTLNRAGVHAAAAALAGGRGGVDAPDAAKKAAAKTLIGLYGHLKEDPPDNVSKLTEAASTSAQITIAEASTGTMTASGGRRYKALLIEGDRWGTSGYYPKKVIERDGPKVWPAGTQMYLNHPTETEEVERPERDVRDLAGTIVSTPVIEGKGLYADIEVFPHAQPLIESIGSAIGLSIRGGGTAGFGTIGGRSGPIIESLTHGVSVDFVTRAGAGGKIVSLAEAAKLNTNIREAVKRTLGAYIEAQLHLELTRLADGMYGNGHLSRPERITLSSAIGDGLTAFTAKVEAEAPQLFERDIWDGPADDTAASTTESARADVAAATALGMSASRFRQLREASSNEIQSALDAAVRAAYGDDNDITQWVYVCDFDPDASTVWYAISDNQSRTTWQQQYELNATDGAATSATLADNRTQVVARTTYVPVPADEQAPDDTDGDNDTDTNVTEAAALTPPAADTPPTPVADGAPPTVSTQPVEEGAGMTGPQNTGIEPGAAGTTDTGVSTAVTEAQNGRRTAELALDESNRQRLAAELQLARYRAVEAARPIVTTMLGESQITTPAAQARVMAQVTAATSVPLTEANVLDEAALREAATAAITDMETVLAEARQGAGAGQVSGLGSANDGAPVDDAAYDLAMTESFRRIGLSDNAAKIAAGGRF